MTSKLIGWQLTAGQFHEDDFRVADGPGVDRFGEHNRVPHSLCELAGAKSIRHSNQYPPGDLDLLVRLVADLAEPRFWLVSELAIIRPEWSDRLRANQHAPACNS